MWRRSLCSEVINGRTFHTKQRHKMITLMVYSRARTKMSLATNMSCFGGVNQQQVLRKGPLNDDGYRCYHVSRITRSSSFLASNNGFKNNRRRKVHHIQDIQKHFTTIKYTNEYSMNKEKDTYNHIREETRCSFSTQKKTSNKKKRQAMKRQLQQNKHQEETVTTTETMSETMQKDTENKEHATSTKTETTMTTPDMTTTRTIPSPTTTTSPVSSSFGTASPTKLELLQFQPDHKDSYNAWQSSLTHPPTLGRNDDWLRSGASDKLLIGPTEDGIMSRDISSDLIELEDMYDPMIHLPYAPHATNWKGYEPATPLSDILMKRIGVVGKPLTTAEYMAQALTHPLHGYYTNPPKTALQKSLLQPENEDDYETDNWDEGSDNNDRNVDDDTSKDSLLIGARGDFVTAPEVSHVFGYSICIWLLTQWQTILGQPDKVQLVELGPGKGTLMMDILQLATSKQLRHFGKCIETIHLIEASSTLRKQQEELLSKHLQHNIDFEFVRKNSHDDGEQNNLDSNGSSSGGDSKGEESTTSRSSDDETDDYKIPIRVEWHDDFASFQRGQKSSSSSPSPVLMVLQEFLDALPVHVFEYTKDGWRERLVDVVSKTDDPPNPNHDPLVPRLRQVVAPDITPAVELLLPQYIQKNEDEQNKDGTNTGISDPFTSSTIQVGTVAEICPQAMFLVQDMANLIKEQGGVALIIDYGQEGTSDTLRAFSNHKQVPLTSYPGQVDVTADVDFFVLKESVHQSQLKQKEKDEEESSHNNQTSTTSMVHAFGPVTQGEFLMRMGASDMVISKIEDDSTTEEEAIKLHEALKYLVLPEHMGERYKVLALGKKRDEIFAPPGFET